MGRQFTLGKNERLKSRKQIEQLFAVGKSFAITPFRVYFLVNDQLPMDAGAGLLQFGVAVGSKNFRRAVDRNRIKRLTREAWRLQNIELKQNVKATGRRLIVFFIYTAKDLPDFKVVKDKVAVALKKLADRINENISSNT